MEECLLIDSDVLIDYLRGHPAAISYLENLTERQIVSVMTVAELYTGIREGNECQALEELLKTFEIIPVTEKTAIIGGLFRRTFLKSHGVGIADAVIAATAEVESATLATLNKKHFPMLSKVIVPYRKS
jgi:predicted nucleic acid-binding protein